MGWLFILLYPTMRFLAVWGLAGLGGVGCGPPPAGMRWRKLLQKKRLSRVFGPVGETEEGRWEQALRFECQN